MGILFSSEYEPITCGEEGCGITFYVPSHWKQKRVQEKASFSCPNGHGRRFCGETEEDKLRRERDRLAQRLAENDDRIKDAENRIVAYKGHLTRSKKRHAAGVCPCCNRSFLSLTRHMQTKHPTYKPGEDTYEPARNNRAK